MNKQNHGVEITVGKTTLLAVGVDGQFVGVSLTEHSNALEMRRVSIELHERVQLEQLREFLDQQLARMP